MAALSLTSAVAPSVPRQVAVAAEVRVAPLVGQHAGGLPAGSAAGSAVTPAGSPRPPAPAPRSAGPPAAWPSAAAGSRKPGPVATPKGGRIYIGSVAGGYQEAL